jgi:hypothetical protein
MSKPRTGGARPGRWLTLAAAGLAAGCGTIREEQRYTELDITLRSYGAALRWGYYETAATFLRPRPGSEPVPPCAPRQDLRVTTYQVRDSGLSDDFSEAHVRATIGYVLLDQNTVRESVDTQTWWYSKEAQRWFLDGGLPEVVCAP